MINIANQNQPLDVSGVAANGTTEVIVSIPGAQKTATPSQARNQNTWTATFTPQELAAVEVPEGEGYFAVTAEFWTTDDVGGRAAARNDAGQPAVDTFLILKDLKAPKKPTATPNGGTYAKGQTVGLESNEGTI